MNDVAFINEKNVLDVCVVGHTNTGKTSLLRTLTRSEAFGEVKNESATTRHVERVFLYEDSTDKIALYDTPGLEDAGGVLDEIAKLSDVRDDGVDKLTKLLDAFGAGALPDFSQEMKVIKAVMNCDVALYVIDVRQPPTSKYKDELAILAMSGVPVVPVFNFVAHTEHLGAWVDVLTRRNLHVYSLFDTVAFDFDNELKLWQNVGTMRPNDEILPKFIKHRQETWQELLEIGNRVIADFLVNVASFTTKVENADELSPDELENAQKSVINAMQTAIRQAESQVAKQLLALYKFYHSPLNDTPLTVAWGKKDLFDKDLLTEYGIRTASGGGVGAIIGAGLDMATLGASLGLGTVVGGLIGGSLANAGAIKDKLTGVVRLTISDETVLVLASRLNGLHTVLRHTGHATQAGINSREQSLWHELPKALAKARQKEHYSGLDSAKAVQDYQINQELRADLVDKLLYEKFGS